MGHWTSYLVNHVVSYIDKLKYFGYNRCRDEIFTIIEENEKEGRKFSSNGESETNIASLKN